MIKQVGAFENKYFSKIPNAYTCAYFLPSKKNDVAFWFDIININILHNFIQCIAKLS